MLHYTKLAAHNAVERLNLDMKLRGEGLERHSYIYFSYLSD